MTHMSRGRRDGGLEKTYLNERTAGLDLGTRHRFHRERADGAADARTGRGEAWS